MQGMASLQHVQTVVASISPFLARGIADLLLHETHTKKEQTLNFAKKPHHLLLKQVAFPPAHECEALMVLSTPFLFCILV